MQHRSGDLNSTCAANKTGHVSSIWERGFVPSYLYQDDERAAGLLLFSEARLIRVPKKCILFPRTCDFTLMQECNLQFLRRVQNSINVFTVGKGYDRDNPLAEVPRLFRISGFSGKKFSEETDRATVMDAWAVFNASEVLPHSVSKEEFIPVSEQFGHSEQQEQQQQQQGIPSTSAYQSATLDTIRAQLRLCVSVSAYCTVTSYAFEEEEEDESTRSCTSQWLASSNSRMVFQGLCNMFCMFLAVPLLMQREVVVEMQAEQQLQLLPPLQEFLDDEYNSIQTVIGYECGRHQVLSSKRRLISGITDAILYHDILSTTTVQMVDGRITTFCKKPDARSTTVPVEEKDLRTMHVPNHGSERAGKRSRFHSSSHLTRCCCCNNGGALLASCKCSVCDGDSSSSSSRECVSDKKQ